MTPSRPYLLRAFYDWLLDNDMTPHLLVNATLPHVQVPQQFVRDGQIVLNVSADATPRLTIGNEFVEFQARFGGIARDISAPLGNVVAIYARENGGGMAFEPEDEAEPADESPVPETPEPQPPQPPQPGAGRPKLQRIK